MNLNYTYVGRGIGYFHTNVIITFDLLRILLNLHYVYIISYSPAFWSIRFTYLHMQFFMV